MSTLQRWCTRVWRAVTRRDDVMEFTPDQLQSMNKTAELESRIKCLECKFYGLDGRTTRLERRQREDPYYTGPERRAANQVNH